MIIVKWNLLLAEHGNFHTISMFLSLISEHVEIPYHQSMENKRLNEISCDMATLSFNSRVMTVFGQQVNGALLHSEELSLIVAMLARQRDRWVVEEFDRLRLLTAGTDARAEEGEHLAPWPVIERVEQTHIVGIVK